MWRDILLILTVIIAVMTWFNVGPSRIAHLVRRYITPGRLFISVTATVTIGAICVPIASALYRGEPIKWGYIVALLYLCLIPWQTIIDYYSSPESKLRKAILLARRFGAIPVLALLWMDFDAPAWHKIALIIGGFLGGVGIRFLQDYIRKRRSNRKG